METHPVKTETDSKPRVVTKEYHSVTVTDNEASSAVYSLCNGIPDTIGFVTKRPAFFLPLGRKIRFRNKLPAYGWQFRSWTPLADGRAEVIFGYAVRLYTRKRAKAKVPSPMYK